MGALNRAEALTRAGALTRGNTVDRTYRFHPAPSLNGVLLTRVLFLFIQNQKNTYNVAHQSMDSKVEYKGN